MISNQDKIQVIQDRIDALFIHVPALEEDILNNPGNDHPEKRSRQEVLNDILLSIRVLEAEKNTLTNQG